MSSYFNINNLAHAFAIGNFVKTIYDAYSPEIDNQQSLDDTSTFVESLDTNFNEIYNLNNIEIRSQKVDTFIKSTRLPNGKFAVFFDQDLQEEHKDVTKALVKREIAFINAKLPQQRTKVKIITAIVSLVSYIVFRSFSLYISIPFNLALFSIAPKELNIENDYKKYYLISPKVDQEEKQLLEGYEEAIQNVERKKFEKFLGTKTEENKPNHEEDPLFKFILRRRKEKETSHV